MAKNKFKNRQVDKDVKSLYNKLLAQVKESNSRIVKIEKQFGKNAWAVSRLEEKVNNDVINAWTNKGRVRISLNMSVEQLKGVQKATKEFLKSKTSTIKGIKETITKTKKSIAAEFSDIDNEDITSEDAEIFYNLLEDNKIREVVDKLGASELNALIEDAKEMNASKTKWESMISNYIDFSNDVEFKEKVDYIYKKYVRR